MIEIKRYTPDDAEAWNLFVKESRNGTFLFDRGYMDYHSDRFEDCSLMAYRGGRMIGIFPASIDGQTVVSHGGLTYGGLILSSKALYSDAEDFLRQAAEYYRSNGANGLIYKKVPYIYNRIPADEDLFALWRMGAGISGRQISSTIDLKNPPKFFNIRKQGIKKASRLGVTVEETTDYEPFWKVLTHNLMERYNRLPVHSHSEIQLLAGRFPENIRLFTATKDGRTLAGVVMFVTDRVAHAQYISANQEGKASGALDLVFSHLITEIFQDKQFFDFGISTEHGGQYLNESLLYQKEGFGGRAVMYDVYTLNLR